MYLNIKENREPIDFGLNIFYSKDKDWVWHKTRHNLLQLINFPWVQLSYCKKVPQVAGINFLCEIYCHEKHAEGFP